MNPTRSKKLIFTLTFIVFLLTTIYLVSDYTQEKSEPNLTLINLESENCKIQTELCNYNIDGLRLSISSDKNIQYLKPFLISVNTSTNYNSNVKKIQIEFKMNGMDMGVNRFLLSKKNINNKEIWQGKALLPICVTGRADWIAELSIYIKDSIYVIKLPVSVEQPNS